MAVRISSRKPMILPGEMTTDADILLAVASWLIKLTLVP